MKMNMISVGKDVSTAFFKYRDCCRHLWNNYFINLEEYDDKHSGFLESYQEISERLFNAMIAVQLFRRWLVKTDDGYYDEIIIQPKPELIESNAMWVRPEPKRQVYVWRQIRLDSPANYFRFIEFFDWTLNPTMECQYVKARLIASDEFPELVGNDFILEALEVKYIKNNQHT